MYSDCLQIVIFAPRLQVCKEHRSETQIRVPLEITRKRLKSRQGSVRTAQRKNKNKMAGLATYLKLASILVIGLVFILKTEALPGKGYSAIWRRADHKNNSVEGPHRRFASCDKSQTHYNFCYACGAATYKKEIFNKCCNRSPLVLEVCRSYLSMSLQ